jgi:hypothetical protein
LREEVRGYQTTAQGLTKNVDEHHRILLKMGPIVKEQKAQLDTMFGYCAERDQIAFELKQITKRCHTWKIKYDRHSVVPTRKPNSHYSVDMPREGNIGVLHPNIGDANCGPPYRDERHNTLPKVKTSQSEQNLGPRAHYQETTTTYPDMFDLTRGHSYNENHRPFLSNTLQVPSSYKTGNQGKHEI